MKILVLSIFPCEIPRHGGQIRLSNILKHLQGLGHDVFCCGVLPPKSHPKTENFLSCPLKKLQEVKNEVNFISDSMFNFVPDYLISVLIQKDQTIRDNLLKKVPFIPELIVVEMPWLFKLAEQMKEVWGNNIPIVYSSENIEHKLKAQILKHCGGDYEEVIHHIKELETYAAMNSNANWVVSESDSNWIRSLPGAKTYIVPNGVEKRLITKEGESHFDKLKLPEKYVLFCGSWHYPNINGLYQNFKNGLGCIPPDSQLVIVGAICYAIKSDARFSQITNFYKRTNLLGVVDDDLLASILNHAHCIILPIRDGEGTNLKTAEAIWTGCYIVSNTTAFRGFEQFNNLKNAYITDNASEFQQKIREFLALERFDMTSCLEKRNAVLWESCLENITLCLNELGH